MRISGFLLMTEILGIDIDIRHRYRHLCTLFYFILVLHESHFQVGPLLPSISDRAHLKAHCSIYIPWSFTGEKMNFIITFLLL